MAFCAFFFRSGFFCDDKIEGGPWFKIEGGRACCAGARIDGGPASAPQKAPGVKREAIAARGGPSNSFTRTAPLGAAGAGDFSEGRRGLEELREAA